MIKVSISLLSVIVLAGCWNATTEIKESAVVNIPIVAPAAIVPPSVIIAPAPSIEKIEKLSPVVVPPAQLATPELIIETVKPVAPVEITVPEIRKVCIEVFDAKAKKNITKCRNVTIHKKYPSTVVPKK